MVPGFLIVPQPCCKLARPVCRKTLSHYQLVSKSNTIWGNFQKTGIGKHVSGHAFGLILYKLFLIRCLLLLQKCAFLLLKVYGHLEGNVFPNIAHENYVSNSNKP